jgi:formiminotetrahydrofolate cyclodeaminase
MDGASFADRPLRSFVDDLASIAPVPGGGSASAVAASIAAALVAMVAGLSDRPRYAEHAGLHADVVRAGRRLSTRALELADEDADAYAGFGAARKLPRGSDAERARRDEAVSSAARRAAQVPLETVALCRDITTQAESLGGRSNVNASSDLVVAALLAEAAARGAALNVEVNLPSVADTAWASTAQDDVRALLADVAALAAATRATVAAGTEREPVGAAGATPAPGPASARSPGAP